MRLDKHKSLILVATLSLIVECVALLYDADFFTFRNNRSAGNGISAGRLFQKQNEVHRRPKSSLMWEEASLSDGVNFYDSILTMEDSTAEIRLNDGGIISVKKDSLIILEPPLRSEEAIKISLKKGSYKQAYKIAQKVQMGQFVVLASANSVIDYKTDGKGKVSVNVVKGKATVAKAKSPEKIRETAAVAETSQLAKDLKDEAFESSLADALIEDSHLLSAGDTTDLSAPDPESRTITSATIGPITKAPPEPVPEKVPESMVAMSVHTPPVLPVPPPEKVPFAEAPPAERKIAKVDAPREPPRVKRKPPKVKRKIASREPVPEPKSPPPAIAKPTEQSSTKIQSSNTSDNHGIFQIGPHFSLARISATDKSNGVGATFLSEINKGFDARWIQAWNSRWESFIGLGATSTQYQAPPSKNLNGASQTLSSYGAGASYWLTNKLGVIGEFAIENNLFVRSVSLSTYRLDSLSTPRVSMKLRYAPISYLSTQAGIETGAQYYMSSTSDTYQVLPGYGYSVNLFLEQIISRTFQLMSGVTYQAKNQSTSISGQATTELGFDVGLKCIFGK